MGIIILCLLTFAAGVILPQPTREGILVMVSRVWGLLPLNRTQADMDRAEKSVKAAVDNRDRVRAVIDAQDANKPDDPPGI